MNVGNYAPLAVAVPLVVAAGIAPFTKIMPKWLSSALSSATAVAVCAMSLALMWDAAAHGTIVRWMGGWQPQHGVAIGIGFAVDPIGAGLSALIALLVFCAIVYTWIAFDVGGTLFHALLLCFLGAMCGYALTGDLFNMFVWFELMTAAAIALTSHKIEEAASIEGAINLAVTNTLAGFVVLIGIALLYARTDALNLAQLGALLSHHALDPITVLAFALIVAGYFVKGAVAPFYFWLDDAHAVAPTPVCILFSGIMVQVALYGVARIFWTAFAGAFAGHEEALRTLFLTAGILTMLGGAGMAFAQRHLKRLLAFSTVSHSGMFVAALGLVGTAGIAAATLFVLAHGLVKSALFICAGNYLNRFRSLDEGVLGGKGREAKATTILFLIGGVALAGLPPFGISAAKSLYDIAMTDRRLVVIAVVAAIASAIDAGAVLRSGLHIGFGIGEPQTTGYSPREEESECPGDRLDSTPWTMVALPALLLALALWVGISVPLHDGVASAAQVFTDSTAYIHAVMNGGGRPVPWIAAPPDTMTGRAIGVAVTLCAALLAFAGLYRRRVPPAIGNIAGAPMRWLRARHSGKFTDYVTYMMAGVAIYGCWFLASLR